MSAHGTLLAIIFHMRKMLLLLLLCIQINAFAQHGQKKDNFNTEVRAARGDLNGDGLIDKTIISMDTVDASVPLRLQVFFGLPNNKYKLVVSSTRIIEPQYPKGGEYSGHQVPYVEIKDGKLILMSDSGNGQSLHTFKYKNQNFELIHFLKTYWDGKNTTTETVFDLLTGIKRVESKGLGSEKIIKKSTTKIWIRPLPKLQDLTAFENKPYY